MTDPRAADSIDLALAARLASRRLELNLSLDSVAGEVGVTYQQIYKYETGRNRVSVGRLFALARALQLDPAALVAELARAP